MRIPTEIFSAIIGGIIGSLLPALLTYVETVRAGYRQRLMLADEIEENQYLLFDYAQIQQDNGRRILGYKDFNLYAWESAKANKLLFLSEYELTYVRIFYSDVQEMIYLVEHFQIYKLDDKKITPEVQHIISLIANDCTEKYVNPENNRSVQLIKSLRRKINLLNYYPIVWGR